MNLKTSEVSILTNFLFGIYLVVLTWFVVFKLSIPIRCIETAGSINLIPFSGSERIYHSTYFSEFLKNILIFLPFGIYISIIKHHWAFYKKFLSFILVSLLFEILQFLLSTGPSAITNIISNSLGGMLGIFIYLLLRVLFKSERKTNKIIKICALIGTIFLPSFIMLLLLYNL